VTGTSGPLSHTTILVTLNVEDFAVNLNPNTSTFTVPQGSTITSTVQLTNLGQVSTTVHLSAPVVPTGPSTTLSQTSISLSPALGTGSSSLTINIGSAAPGTYTVVINATIGPLIHTQTIIITVIQPVVKFVSVSTPPSSVAVGQEVDVRVDLLNAATIGLSFNVTMDVNSVTVSMQQVSLAPGQDSGTITLKWDTTSYSTGDYNIKIRLVEAIATGPTPASVDLAAENTPSQATITLTSTQGSPFLPGNTGLIVAVAAVLILVAALATVLFIRRRKSAVKA